tara:strand:+ start:633 stop:1025 length:393 start_codon:yes stop_codon:yes gene_type:complete
LKKVLIALFLAMASGISAQHLLTVQFTGMSSDEGHVLVKVVNEKNEQVAGQEIPVSGGKATFSLKLKEGQYAISAFHDVNDNKELDTNWMGIPKEKYGFSNNARGTFGPPDLKDQLVEVRSDKSLSITLK